MPLGICLSRAGSLLLLLLLRGVGARELALLLQTPFSRFSSSVDSPQFSPHVPRRGNLGESSVSCSRVLSSRESRSSERGSRVDKRARSREVSSRGRRCRSRSLSSYRSRFSGCECGRRSSSASRSSRGRSCCERSRSSDRCRSQRGGSRSRRAWSRSSDRYRSRRDLSRCARSRSLAAAAPTVSVRVSLPVGGCGAFVRDRTLSRIARLTARGHACDYLLLLPACGPWKQAGWPDVGHRRVWGPLSLSLLWPGAAAGIPPVLEGRPLPLSRLFFPGACQVRHELVWLLFPGSIWGLGGCDRFCSSVVGYRVSRFGCCWGGHFVCCDCDACWGWRFCLLLPLLFLACLVISSVRGSPALAGVAVGCLVMGPTDVLGALQGKVSFFCPLFASSGGGAVSLPRIRLWMTDLSLLLPVPGMRLEVRILVALPGILSARLVLGRRGLLQGLSLCQSGARLRPPRPSGVAAVDGSFTFAGFRLACGDLGVFSVAYSLFSSVGKFAGPPRLEVLVRILPPASGRSFIGAPQRGSCC